MFRPSTQLRCAKVAVLLAVGASLLSGCVVERKSRPGLTVLPSRAAPGSTAPGASSAPTSVPLPSGPIAAPAAAATNQSARILVRVDQLATIPFDGQVLPLVSPDGRFIAAQQGEPPSWPTLLAQPGAEPANTTKLAVYDISQSPPESNARAIEFPSPLPPGLVLGRSCDSRGFLVESPREDGCRWIGRASWLGGNIEWLVQGSAVNSHAVFTLRGDLLYTRRTTAGSSNELVLLTPRGESVRSAGDGSYLFPLCTTEKDLAYAFNLTPQGLQVEAIRIAEDFARGGAGSGNYKLGRTFAQALVGRPGDVALAYQITSPVQSVVVTGKEHEEVQPYPLIFLHPDFMRMVSFDTQTSTYTLLAPNSVSAIRWSEASGYLCTTRQGLYYTPEPTRNETKRRPDIKLDGTPYVPRATADKSRPVILFGPSSRNPQGLLWVRSVVATDQPVQ